MFKHFEEFNYMTTYYLNSYNQLKFILNWWYQIWIGYPSYGVDWFEL